MIDEREKKKRYKTDRKAEKELEKVQWSGHLCNES